MIVAFMPLHILLCDEVLLYFVLHVWARPDMSGLGAGYVRSSETSRSRKVDWEPRRCV
jgi:hypothetical protein